MPYQNMKGGQEMFTISNVGIGQMDFSSKNTQTGKTSKDNASDSFASVMDLASGSTSTTDSSDRVNDYTESYKKNDIDKISSKDNVETDAGKTDDYRVEDKKIEKTTDNIDDKKPEVCEKDEDDVLVQKVAETLADFINQISEILNVDVEEIKGALEELNMDVSDLVDQGSLKQLVLKISGIQEVDLLINEDLNMQMNQIQNELENLLNQFEGNLKEFISNNFEQINSSMSDELNSQNKGIVLENVAQDIEPDYSNDDINMRKMNAGSENSEIQGLKNEASLVNETMSNEANFQSDSSKDFGNQNNSNNGIVENLNQAIDNMVQNDIAFEDIEGIDDIQQADIIRQVIEEIKASVSKETTSLEVMLNPASLGKVHITVANKNGSMQAQIVAETEAAKNAIESGIASLKEAFENHELKIDAIEVMVGTYQFGETDNQQQYEQQQQSEKTSGNINLNEDIDSDELSEAEQIEIQMMQTMGNTVSYTV